MTEIEDQRESFWAASKIIWTLAWPAVALNGFQMFNSLLDAYFIGHLESAALTAHGAGLNIVFLLFSLGMTVSVASTALVSRFYGAGEQALYREANRHCVRMAHLLGLALGLLAVGAALWVSPILVPEGNARAAELLKWFLLAWAPSLAANSVITTLAGSLRGTGDTRSPMVISGLQIVMHIVLNIFFINKELHWNLFGASVTVPGLGFGLPGAALALTLSSFVSMFIYLSWVKNSSLGSSWSFSLPDPEWARRILKIAVPSGVQAILRVASFTVFTLILRNTTAANEALGALRVGIAIESIMFMPAFGLSMAASALVGQSLGAKKPQRAERLGWISSHYGALVILLLSAPIFIYAPNVASLLTGGDKPGIQTEAIAYIRYVITTEVLFGYAMILIGALQGAGEIKSPLWITIVSLWFFRVPLAALLAIGYGMNSTGCWIAMSSSQAIQGLLAIVMFSMGRWKTVKV